MSGKLSLKFLSLSLIAVLAGCNASSPVAGLNLGQSAAPQQPVTPVVQAYCPQVVLLDDTAVRSVYAGNAKDNPEKLLYRASLGDATRSCTANDQTLTITVMAQGRIVLGPAGKAGPTTLPVVVEVIDNDKVIYSQVTQFPVTVPPDGSTQFIFAKNDVSIPNSVGGVSRFTRLRLGFNDVAAKKTPRRPR